ncbi:MAG: FAD-linked oxidase C-terminal domain-containing protein [Actinomycetota bacterium]|nr:FAD-linked oxidase C-terminal domain-containing protein [Actinomycetota bacterium]|tara:strand:- start:7353 stop:8807 length:1455 start_codon:yes stop_codon:yes gene_type:complete
MRKRRQKITDPLLEALISALDEERVTDGASARLLYSKDGSVMEGGRAGIVCFPETTAEVAKCVEISKKFDCEFVTRGAGTGLAGGSVPCNDPIVIVTTRMNKILEVDLEKRVAWVQPGVVNLDLSLSLRGTGFHFAPDPSSQQACTIGGNVANNSGGPHCLAYGVTNSHVAAIEVVLPDASVVEFGSSEGEMCGYDLRGVFVGGEGTLGIATRIAVRLTEDPPAVATLLLDFSKITEAAETVSAIIANGILPAALELMDKNVVAAVEPFAKAGYPLDAEAVLIAEVDGLPDGVSKEIEKITQLAKVNGARQVRIATDQEERERIWKGRKSAFGAIAKIKPDYYLHDTVIPRRRLAEVIEKVYDIAEKYELLVMNVFHAGDGNLHPLLVFDARIPGTLEKVRKAGEEIVATSLEAGGVLSGEHGIGLEKQRFMTQQFSKRDLEAQDALRRAFDPDNRSNPHKVLPTGASCGEIDSLKEIPEGVWI